MAFFDNMHKLLQNALFSSTCNVCLLLLLIFISWYKSNNHAPVQQNSKENLPQAYIYVQPWASLFLNSHRLRSGSRNKCDLRHLDPRHPDTEQWYPSNSLPGLCYLQGSTIKKSSTQESMSMSSSFWVRAQFFLLLAEARAAEKRCWFFCVVFFVVFVVFFIRAGKKTWQRFMFYFKAAVETLQRKSVHFLFLVQRIYMLFLMIWAFSTG